MKNRRLLLTLVTLLLVLALPMAAFAAQDDSDAKLRYVTDAAKLMTAEQDAALEARAKEISQEYEFSVYIIALDNYQVYAQQTDFWDASVEIYDSYELGWGPEKAGACLMLSMQERDFCLHFNSDQANYVFSEGGRDLIEDRILGYFRDNDYYGGFNEYLNCCQEYLEAARNGTPIEEGSTSRNDEESSTFVNIVFFCLPGLFAAAVTAVVLVVPMHSAGTKNQADDYAVPGSMRLTRQSDHFLRRTVTRTPRQKEQSSSSSSGGSVSTSHSTGSHSGRTGKF